MPAFNDRFKPKTVGHMPLYSVLGMVGMLITAVLSLILPGVLKMIPGTLFVLCVFVTAFFFWIGDDLPFLRVKWESWRMNRCIRIQGARREK